MWANSTLYNALLIGAYYGYFPNVQDNAVFINHNTHYEGLLILFVFRIRLHLMLTAHVNMKQDNVGNQERVESYIT